MGCKKGVRHRKWTKEEKLYYVKMHLDDHVPMKEIARLAGISTGLLSSWVTKYQEDGEEALIPHQGNRFAALHISKSLTEMEQLKLIVAKQEIEIARLKKGYYVKGVGAGKEFVTGSEKNMK